jgi:hypothetical protein
VGDVSTFLDQTMIVFLVVGTNTVEGGRFEHVNVTGKKK